MATAEINETHRTDQGESVQDEAVALAQRLAALVRKAQAGTREPRMEPDRDADVRP